MKLFSVEYLHEDITSQPEVKDDKIHSMYIYFPSLINFGFKSTRVLNIYYSQSTQRSYRAFGEPQRIRFVLFSELGLKHRNVEMTREVSVHNQEKPSKNTQVLKSGKDCTA